MTETRKDIVGNGNDILSLIVKSSGRKEIIEVSEDSSISNFKEVIARKFDVDVQSFRLIYAGKILKDTDTIKTLNIKSGYTIYMVVKPTTTTSTLQNNALSTTTADNEQNVLYRNLIQNYINSPDILRSLLTSNPAIQQLIESNPELGHMLNNPTLLREIMEMMRNPSLANEFIRNADRAVSNLESLPGGFNALQSMYQNIEEPFMNATNNSQNPFANLFPSTTSNQQGTENRDPLPNPWSLNGPVNNETNDDISASNPLLQNMLEQFQNYLSQSENISPEMLQNFQGLLSNITSDDFINTQQQANDTFAQILSQNTGEHSDIANLSPDVINTLILPALLLAGTVRNQPPDLSNNNATNLNNISQLFSQVHPQDHTDNTMNLQQHYTTQMQQLSEMGFSNEQANLQALISSFGDLNRAIEILLSRNFAN